MNETYNTGGVRPRLVIAGASGFIGTALCRDLSRDYDIVALTRSPSASATGDAQVPVRWQYCDLFSMSEVESALAGADYGIYLVHSMLPCSRLTQASPADMDLLLADNFARAAARNGLRQILFLGAVMPETFRISRLIWSRREVEMVLGSYSTPVTVLRADLVVGPGGSSAAMLIDLVRRLPLIPLPRAARSHTQPIALADVLRAVRFCLGNPQCHNNHFDIGGPEPLSYRQIVKQTAEVLGLKRWLITLPLLPLRLVSLGARLISGAPKELVQPLVESLPYDTPVRDNPVQQSIAADAIPFRKALLASLEPESKRLSPSPRLISRTQDDEAIRKASVVRSIQRIILPPGENARWVAGNYFRWLPRFCWPFVECQFDQIGSCTVGVRFTPLRLLVLTFQPELSAPQRQTYFITGGLLARSRSSLRGRFEFRDVLNGRFTIAAIHDFAPALPWYFYIVTQAPIHLLVMRAYQRRLAALAR